MLDIAIYDPSTNQRLLGCSTYVQSASIRCNEHGYESLSADVPLTFGQALRMYQIPTLMELRCTDHAGYVLFRGRMEDVGIFADDNGSGLRLTAYGPQQAFRDAPQTALWSTQDFSQWTPLTPADFSIAYPGQYSIDIGRRISISPEKNGTFNGGAPAVGTVAYQIPSGSARSITRVEFTYDFKAPVGWEFGLVAADNYANTGGSTLWSIAGNGAVQSGSQTIAVSSKAVVRFYMYWTAASATYTGETGTDYARVNSVRVTSATPTIDGGTIASWLVGQVVALNSGMISDSTARIQSPGYDLTDEVIEDELAADTLDRLVKLGDNQTEPRLWQWAVWEDLALRFEPRGTNASTWYVDAATIEINRTISQLYNSAYSVYTNAGGETVRTAVSSDTASESRYKIKRRQAIQADTSNAAQALVTRNALLIDTKRLIPQISVGFTTLYSVNGIRVPVYRARPGDSIVIRNLPPALALEQSASFRIIASELNDGVMTVTPESVIPVMETMLARREEGI